MMKPTFPLFQILAAAGCFWLSGISAALAEIPALVLTDAPTGVVDVAAHAGFLLDDSAKLDIAEVDSEGWSGRFAPDDSKIPTFGFTRAAVWMRCVVRSESDREKTLLFEIGTARLSHVTWYLVADGRVERTLRAGAADPIGDGEGINRFPTFEVAIPPGAVRAVYARVESNTSIWLPLRAGSPLAMHRLVEQRTSLDLLQWGFCVAGAFFSVLLGIAQRQRLFFHLAAFAFGYAFYCAVFNGYARAAWPGMPLSIDRQFFMIVAGLAIYVFIRFNSRYLGLDSMTRVERVFQRLGEWVLLAGTANFLIFDFYRAVRWMHPIVVLGFLFATVAIVSRMRRCRRAEDAWFLLAWGALGVSTLLLVLQAMDWLPVVVPFHYLQQSIFPAILSAFFLAVVTRQRELQEKQKQLDILRIAERQAFELTENMPAGTYVVALMPRLKGGVDLAFRFASRRFLEIFGLDRERLMADPNHVLDAIHPEDRESMNEGNQRAFATRKPFRWEGRIQAGGQTRWVNISSNPRGTEEGVTVWEGVVTDITARVEAEKKLAEALEAEQRLRSEADTLREVAEQASKEKSLFLANMSHEVRTPLSALVSLSQAMWMESEKHALPEDFEQLLQRVRSGGKYLNLVLTNLLDVSASESGRVPVHEKKFYLADWAGDVRNILEPIAESHGAKLHWTLPQDDNEEFESDPMRLTQILLNLAHNAIKFGGDGTAVVHIGIDARAGILELGVRDNGPGIQAPRLEELFQAYEQGKTQPVSYERGVGLGLAVVNLNLRLLGGTLDARNVEPHGMDFQVRIPAWNTKAGAE